LKAVGIERRQHEVPIEKAESSSLLYRVLFL
jgi:hypothetical protein